MTVFAQFAATVFGATLCARADMSLMGSAMRTVELLITQPSLLDPEAPA